MIFDINLKDLRDLNNNNNNKDFFREHTFKFCNLNKRYGFMDFDIFKQNKDFSFKWICSLRVFNKKIKNSEYNKFLNKLNLGVLIK